MRPPARRRPLAALTLLAALAGCATGRPPWREAGELTRVDVRDLATGGRHSLLDRATLDELAACFARARNDGQAHHDPKATTHTLGMSGTRRPLWFLPRSEGGGFWYFSATTGELARLQMKTSPVYRLDEPDRSRVAALLAPPEPATSPAE